MIGSGVIVSNIFGIIRIHEVINPINQAVFIKDDRGF